MLHEPMLARQERRKEKPLFPGDTQRGSEIPGDFGALMVSLFPFPSWERIIHALSLSTQK